METRNPDRLTLIAFVLTILFAGNNAIAVKYSNAELPPFFGAAIRFTLAAIILFIVVLIMRLQLPRGRSLLGAVIYGTLSTGLNFALLYWALEYIPAGLSMVILALVPLLTFLFAWAHRQESFRWTALFGALLAVIGIGIIAREQLSADVPLLPMLAVVGAAACFAESSVLIKSYPQTHPITTNAVALATGSVILFVLSALWRETPALPTLPATWGAYAYLVVFGSVATFVLSIYVIKRWTASASSYLFVLMPIVTVSVSALLTNETISTALILGAVFVLAGVYVGGIAKPDQFNRIFSGVITQREDPCPDC